MKTYVTLFATALALTSSGCASCNTGGAKTRNLAELVQLKGDKIEVGESIFFETGSAVIDAKSTDLLDAVADILKNTPGIAKLTIEGHTDSTGDAEFNKTLSQKRADAVKDYIAGKGIEAARLEAKGFGPDQPIASNDTEEGRAQNRRVEFKVTR